MHAMSLTLLLLVLHDVRRTVKINVVRTYGLTHLPVYNKNVT